MGDKRKYFRIVLSLIFLFVFSLQFTFAAPLGGAEGGTVTPGTSGIVDPNAGLGGAIGGTVTPGTSGIPIGAGSSSGGTGGLVPCNTNCTLCHLIIGFEKIFKWGLSLLFVAAMLFITVSGVMYMVSSGNKAMMDAAKKAITLSLTGFTLFLLSWLIVASVLTALGYKQAGSWSTFSCDTTQTKGPSSAANQPGSGTGAKPGSGTGGALGNTVYEYGKKYYDSNGVLHTDCSGYAEERRIAAGLGDPGRDTATQARNAVSFDESQLREGSLIFSSSGSSPSGRHVGVYNGDGTVSDNAGRGKDVVTRPLGQYTNGRNVTGMLI